MRPDGLAVHIIDIPLTEIPSSYYVEKLKIIADLFFGLFQPYSADKLNEADFAFRCMYATNPDSEMYRWGTLKPIAFPVLAIQQYCSILMVGTRMAKNNIL